MSDKLEFIIASISAEMLYRLAPTRFTGKPTMFSPYAPSFTNCERKQTINEQIRLFFKINGEFIEKLVLNNTTQQTVGATIGRPQIQGAAKQARLKHFLWSHARPYRIFFDASTFHSNSDLSN